MAEITSGGSWWDGPEHHERDGDTPETWARRVAAYGEPGRRRPERVGVSFAWFPSEEWAKAVARWPDLLDDRAADHGEYSRQTEARLKTFAKHDPAMVLAVSPLTVEGLEADASARGEDPGSGAARSVYAAELARVGEAVAWPPGRNDPCWCGSGAKYKRCCGPAPAHEPAP